MQIVFERKDAERNCQLGSMKQYFDRKRMVFDARQAKFLRMYPYSGGAGGADLGRFEAAVRNAGDIQRTAIMQAYEAERDYWRSSYVMNCCNSRVHIHIMNTLEAMGEILHGVTCSHASSQMPPVNPVTNRMIRVNASDTHTPEHEKMKHPAMGNNWGKTGEAAVDYVLKWLPASYRVVAKDCTGKYGEKVILLKNSAFSDEHQEFDHLVIGPQGVFNIETKNYSGKLDVDRAGNWSRLKKGETEWAAEENPAQQLFRHHVLLQSIVGDSVPIIDVICMSHPALMITGQENSRIPIVKKDLLADFIVNYRPAGLTPEAVSAIDSRISNYKTNL